MAISKIPNVTIKRITLTGGINARNSSSGLYFDANSGISPSRVIGVFPVYSDTFVVHPVLISMAHNHATRICYFSYARADSISQTDNREYYFDVFYV